MTEREALNWEPIREFWRNNSGVNWDELEAAIKEALAQPEQEPVGWIDDGGEVFWKDKSPKDGADLYTTPPQRKPLTDEEIYEAINNEVFNLLDFVFEFGTQSKGIKNMVNAIARAIEAAHGIKE